MQLYYLMALAFVAAAAIVVATAAVAQQPGRIRGQIEKVDGAILAQGERRQHDECEGGRRRAGSGAGQGLTRQHQEGIAGIPQPDGSIRAFSIHIFLPAQRGVVPDRHGPWDARPGSTMTNAYVEDLVQSKDGETVMVKYKDGEKKIIVTPETVIAAVAPGNKSELKVDNADHHHGRGEAAGWFHAGEGLVCRARRKAGDVMT